MRTLRLLWEMTLRGGAWGFPAGLLLGCIYSMAALGTFTLLSRLAGASNSPPPPLFLIYTILLFGFMGSVVGGMLGVVSGPIGGFLCFLLTRLFFYPLRQVRRYRAIVEIAGTAYGALAALIGLQFISRFPIGPPVGGTAQLVLFYILPALIASVASLFVSRQVATWYVNQNESSPTGETTGTIPAMKPLAS